MKTQDLKQTCSQFSQSAGALAAAILLVFFALACSFNAGGESKSAESNLAAKKTEEIEAQSAIAGKTDGDETEIAQTNLTGTYRSKSGRNNNAIGVEDLGGNRLRINIAANYEYKDNSGEWMANSGGAGGIVNLKSDAAVLVPEGYPDCPITLKFSGGKIIVSHEGAGSDCGFGGNVTASGTYTKTSNERNQDEMIDDEPETHAGKSAPSGGERIRFNPGASSATIGGTAISGEEKVYLVGARAGQTMSVRITENSRYNDVVFHIVALDGSFPMGTTGEGVDEQSETSTEWSGRIPKTGDYKIVIGTIESKKANFKMSVEIR